MSLEEQLSCWLEYSARTKNNLQELLQEACSLLQRVTTRLLDEQEKKVTDKEINQFLEKVKCQNVTP